MISRILQLSVASMLALPSVSFCADKNSLENRRDRRAAKAEMVKKEVTKLCAEAPMHRQAINGDEERYSDLHGSFGKSLAHTPDGFIKPTAFVSLKKALQSGKNADFEKIEMGEGIARLANPQASLCYSLVCNDSWMLTMRPAPAFASAESAGEMVELYWSALVRDVPFNHFDSNEVVASATQELSTLSDFKGPKERGKVTPRTFLRSNAPGVTEGPYISQFLYQPVPYGTTQILPDQEVPTPGSQNDFLTSRDDLIRVLNGRGTAKYVEHERWPLILRTPRDLAEYVHRDGPGQAAFNAALILLSYGGEAIDSSNPYLSEDTQGGFVTFGASDVLNLLSNAVQEGMKAAWYQKWQVNRRLRPEEFGLYVDKQLSDKVALDVHPELLNSRAIRASHDKYGSYLLPLAYPEGAPTHPSYPAAHAVSIGAAITVLKAFFKEDFVIPEAVAPDRGNMSLEDYEGALTVGGELNKLAANIALGRDHAGVHYRSDSVDGLLLGEQVALDLLSNQAMLYNEDFSGFHLVKFDGTSTTVGGTRGH